MHVSSNAIMIQTCGFSRMTMTTDRLTMTTDRLTMTTDRLTMTTDRLTMTTFRLMLTTLRLIMTTFMLTMTTHNSQHNIVKFHNHRDQGHSIQNMLDSQMHILMLSQDFSSTDIEISTFAWNGPMVPGLGNRKKIFIPQWLKITSHVSTSRENCVGV